MSSCLTCLRLWPTPAQTALSPILLSGALSWRKKFRSPCGKFSLPCSTPAHPLTCFATDRWVSICSPRSSHQLYFHYITYWFIIFVSGGYEATWAEPRDRRKPSLTTFPRGPWPPWADGGLSAKWFTTRFGVCGEENGFWML